MVICQDAVTTSLSTLLHTYRKLTTRLLKIHQIWRIPRRLQEGLLDEQLRTMTSRLPWDLNVSGEAAAFQLVTRAAPCQWRRGSHCKWISAFPRAYQFLEEVLLDHDGFAKTPPSPVEPRASFISSDGNECTSENEAQCENGERYEWYELYR